MKIISTGAAEIMLVDDLSSGTSILDCEIVTNQSVIPYGKQLCIPDGCYKSFPNFKYIDLPKGYNYTILNRAKELTEDQWQSILPNYGGKIFDYDPKRYLSFPDYAFENHPFESRFFDTAIESGHSLLKEQGILLENPMEPVWEQTDANGRPYNKHFDYYSYVSAYNEAQTKVKNPLVIKAEKII